MPERLTYGIAAAARMTGLPAETLRIWERRYGGLRPRRTAGGRRTYDDEEIARLRMIARALAAGHRPGAVVALSRPALSRLIGHAPRNADATADLDATPTVGSCIDALRANDGTLLRARMRRAALLLGVRRFIDELADPLAVRVGAMWAAGEIAVRQEHVFTECLATEFRTMLSALEGTEKGPAVVLATFPGELHALGLGMAGLRIASRRAVPRLLGPDCPPGEIAEAAITSRASAVGISVSAAASARTTERYTRQLVAALGDARVRIWLGGAGASEVRIADRRVRLVRTSTEIDLALIALQTSAASVV
jgi:MerR family transcriptional regulator, light-induced transcriptional regulator